MSYKGSTGLFPPTAKASAFPAPCKHLGVTRVWADVPVFAAQKSEVYDTLHALVLDCTGKGAETRAGFSTRAVSIAGDLAPRYEALVALSVPEPTYVTIDWPDGGVPPVQPGFWRELAHLLHASGDSIVVCCMGSHGRTGTALVALRMAMIALGHIVSEQTLGELVDEVRKSHCESAVETAAQVTYLRAIADVFEVAHGPDEIEGSYTFRYVPPAPMPTALYNHAAKPASATDWLDYDRGAYEANRDFPTAVEAQASGRRAAKRALRKARAITGRGRKPSDSDAKG